MARPAHRARHPVHVTLRAERRLPNLRRQSLFFEVRRALGRVSRAWFRLLHFSVQADHVHLLVEAKDKSALSRGMGGLAIRVARAINAALGRRGRVWGDRYHARALRTPREVRHGLVYVLMNFRKHAPDARGFDVCSSAWWFEGWTRAPSKVPPRWVNEEAPICPPAQWLSASGWKRYGLIAPHERPKESPPGTLGPRGGSTSSSSVVSTAR